MSRLGTHAETDQGCSRSFPGVEFLRVGTLFNLGQVALELENLLLAERHSREVNEIAVRQGSPTGCAYLVL